MKTSLLLFLLTVVSVVAAESDIVPTDPKTPLFQLYEMQLSPPRESDPHTPQMKLKKVLLTVFTLSDLRFSRGESGAQAILNRKDARIFSQLTHTHDYLVLLAGDKKASVVMHITDPIDDGVISFSAANYGRDVARYLRRRYGVIH
jgi:hypothetical protein